MERADHDNPRHTCKDADLELCAELAERHPFLPGISLGIMVHLLWEKQQQTRRGSYAVGKPLPLESDLITYLEFARLALSMRRVNNLGEATDLSDTELNRLEEQLNSFMGGLE